MHARTDRVGGTVGSVDFTETANGRRWGEVWGVGSSGRHVESQSSWILGTKHSDKQTDRWADKQTDRQ